MSPRDFGTVILDDARTYRVESTQDAGSYKVVRVETGLHLGTLTLTEDSEAFSFAPMRWMSDDDLTHLIKVGARLVRGAP